MERPKPPRSHETPSPQIKHYAAQLVAGSVVGVLEDGRAIRLADPVEHGYTVDPLPDAGSS